MATDAGRGPDAGSVPMTEEEKKAVAVYKKALERGRLSTQKKAWPLAIAAFDEALAARPEDARALAERGYAKLLAKDLDGAERDLERASKGGIADKDVAAQAFFNLGLVEEARGRDEPARLAFARSTPSRRPRRRTAS